MAICKHSKTYLDNTFATVETYMGNKVYLRPLIFLAKQELAVPRRASKVKANTQQHPSSVTEYHHASVIPRRRRPFLSPASPGHSLQRRMFSVSLAAKAAVIVSNPRKDEDGNEMLIDITARAAKVFPFHFSRPHHPTTANEGSSVLKKL